MTWIAATVVGPIKNIDFRLPDMHHFMQLLTSLSIVAGGSSRYFNVTYSWKQVEYEFPNDTIRDALIESNDYIPNNNMPLGLAVWCDKMFITVPRWKAGVLSTLNSVSMRDKSRE